MNILACQTHVSVKFTHCDWAVDVMITRFVHFCALIL